MKELKKCIEINAKIEADNLELNRVNTNIHEQNERIKNALKECKEQFKEYREVMNETLVFNAENKNKAEHKTTVEAVELINLINSNSERKYKIIKELLSENKKGLLNWWGFIIYVLKTAFFGSPFLFMYWVFTSFDRGNIIFAIFIYVIVVVGMCFEDWKEEKHKKDFFILLGE
jgi:uncharacterized membrane protein